METGRREAVSEHEPSCRVRLGRVAGREKRTMTETTALRVQEPKLRVEKPAVWQEYIWRAQEAFGIPTGRSREVVAARLYEYALGVYKSDVEECGRIADRLKGVYDKVRSAVHEDEKELRNLEALLGKQVEIDGRRLGKKDMVKL